MPLSCRAAPSRSAGFTGFNEISYLLSTGHRLPNFYLPAAALIPLHGRGRDGRKPFTPLASNASSRFDRIFRPLFRNEACRRRLRKWREQRRRKWILVNTHRFSRGNNGRLIDPMEIRRGNYEPRLPNLMNSNRWRKTRRKVSPIHGYHGDPRDPLKRSSFEYRGPGIGISNEISV